MKKEEYCTVLHEIILAGLGFDAIRDLAEMLANYDANMLACMRELRAEQKAIKKICEGNISAKEKVQTVLTMIQFSLLRGDYGLLRMHRLR